MSRVPYASAVSSLIYAIFYTRPYIAHAVGVVGVPMFWLDWQDQKMRQHHNHFGALGSSPPGPGEGSLQIELRMIHL